MVLDGRQRQQHHRTRGRTTPPRLGRAAVRDGHRPRGQCVAGGGGCCLYIGFGSPVGFVPFIYFAVSLGSLVVFGRTRRFQPFLVTQLLDILLTTAAGQMFVGGFQPSGAVGLWGILAPLGALVFLRVREAVRWFLAFVLVFMVTGVAGEVLFPDADLPAWFFSVMLASNVIGTGTVAFTVLASFAHATKRWRRCAPSR